MSPSLSQVQAGRTPSRWVVLAIVSTALLLISVDMTVLYIALPRLTFELGATNAERLWIVNAYPLVMAGLLLSMGTLGDRLGHRRLFMGGLAVFGVASLAAAFAPDPGFLIAARALLAVGAAMMMPATLSIIRITFSDERERRLAIGVWAAVASGGAALGPVVGGLLLEFFWWGSVFLINVPVVLAALLATPGLVPRLPGNRARKWSVSGSLLATVGLVGVVYAVKEAGGRDPSWAIVALTGISGVAFLAAFAAFERRKSDPMVDFALFRHRVFSAGVATAMAAMIALVGMEMLWSQRLQLVQGFSPLEAGLAMLPIPLAAFVAGPLAGLLAHAMGDARLMWRSLLVAGAGLGGFLLVHDAGYWAQLPFLLALGAGIGGTMTGASSAIMSNAPAEKAGMAASIEEVSYELGGTVGVAAAGSLLTLIYSRSFSAPAGVAVPPRARDSLDEAIMEAQALGPEQAAALLEAAVLSFDRAFFAALLFPALLLVAVAAAVALATRR